MHITNYNDRQSNRILARLAADQHCMVIDMPRGKEKQIQRHEQILSRLQESGEVTIEELCTQLGASVVTIRRDLDELEKRSLLKRTHGGAVPIGPLFYEPFKKDSSFQDKIGSFAEEKRRIARRASEMITPGATIALTGGTTTTEIIRCLNAMSGITIVTNTVNVAMELSSRKDIDVVVTGGHLRGNWFTLIGPLATASACIAICRHHVSWSRRHRIESRTNVFAPARG